jgi:hypothetical protein
VWIQGGFLKLFPGATSSLKEFPQDSELADLLIFARAEFAQLVQKRKIEDTLQTIAKKVDAEQLKGAVSAAEKALTRFPGDPALNAALEQARARTAPESPFICPGFHLVGSPSGGHKSGLGPASKIPAQA